MAIHTRAMLLVFVGAVLLSSSGVLIRLIETASDWQIVFWRGISFAFGVGVILFSHHRGKAFYEIRKVGWPGVVAGILLGGTLIGFVISVRHTTVANALFIMSAVPLFTAILARHFLKEPIRAHTMIAILASTGGVGLMVSDGISGGQTYGNLMALFAAFCTAGFIVQLRRGKLGDMTPSLMIGAVASSLFAAGVLGGDVRLSMHDFLICMALGGIIASLSLYLYVLASRNLVGAEFSLLVTLEFILGPLWVFLVLDETPSSMALLGGCLVLFAVGSHSLVAPFVAKIRANSRPS